MTERKKSVPQIINELEEIKIEIDKAKRETERDEGKRENIMEQLKKNYKVETLESAVALIAELEEKEEKLKKELVDGFAKMEEKYAW